MLKFFTLALRLTFMYFLLNYNPFMCLGGGMVDTHV